MQAKAHIKQSDFTGNEFGHEAILPVQGQNSLCTASYVTPANMMAAGQSPSLNKRALNKLQKQYHTYRKERVYRKLKDHVGFLKAMTEQGWLEDYQVKQLHDAIENDDLAAIDTNTTELTNHALANVSKSIQGSVQTTLAKVFEQIESLSPDYNPFANPVFSLMFEEDEPDVLAYRSVDVFRHYHLNLADIKGDDDADIARIAAYHFFSTCVGNADGSTMDCWYGYIEQDISDCVSEMDISMVTKFTDSVRDENSTLMESAALLKPLLPTLAEYEMTFEEITYYHGFEIQELISATDSLLESQDSEQGEALCDVIYALSEELYKGVIFSQYATLFKTDTKFNSFSEIKEYASRSNHPVAETIAECCEGLSSLTLGYYRTFTLHEECFAGCGFNFVPFDDTSEAWEVLEQQSQSLYESIMSANEGDDYWIDYTHPDWVAELTRRVTINVAFSAMFERLLLLEQSEAPPAH